jgi:hypothetical protein
LRSGATRASSKSALTFSSHACAGTEQAEPSQLPVKRLPQHKKPDTVSSPDLISALYAQRRTVCPLFPAPHYLRPFQDTFHSPDTCRAAGPKTVR